MVRASFAATMAASIFQNLFANVRQATDSPRTYKYLSCYLVQEFASYQDVLAVKSATLMLPDRGGADMRIE
jgi:hypothetical protein